MERENLLNDAAPARRVRVMKKNGCCFWVAPVFVVLLLCYGLAIALYGAIVQRWSGAVAVQILLGALLLALWALAMVSYVQVVRVPPGLVENNDFLLLPQYVGRPVEPIADDQVASQPPVEAARTVKWCVKCELYKPDRAHHCSRVGGCVLRMDHFCPWINNCVGFRNRTTTIPPPL